MLALHPEYQEKVFQELRDIFPEQQSDVTAEDITKFQYTEQFIKESMRLTPTVPLVTRYAKRDLKIGLTFKLENIKSFVLLVYRKVHNTSGYRTNYVDNLFA